MGGSKLYMEDMWGNIPAGILEKNVLRFLPLASLCRFRTVCKDWNRWIGHPDFASSHAQTVSAEDYALVTWRSVPPLSPISMWEVLDLVTNRFFTLNDDFLSKHLKPELLLPCHDTQQRILAADGGLFCLLFRSKPKTSLLLVCNPVTRTAKELPLMEGWTTDPLEVAMSTERVSMEYEIFVFHLKKDRYPPEKVDIYESKTGRWRTVTSAVPPLDEPGRRLKFEYDFVNLNNGFYKIFQSGEREYPTLVFYDKYTCMAMDLGLDLPGSDEDCYNMKLFVSQGKLFCAVLKMSDELEDISLRIFEVLLASKECRLFTEMPRELLHWFESDYIPDSDDLQLYDEPKVVIGFANSILFCSCTGRCVSYNFLDKSWHINSDNLIVYDSEEFLMCCPEMYGGSQCLSLCAP